MPENLIAIEHVSQQILLTHGQKVMLDADLAELFGVPTKVFNPDNLSARRSGFSPTCRVKTRSTTHCFHKAATSNKQSGFNQAIKRNFGRFPADFMLQLTENEHESLRSQIVTSKTGRGGRRYIPYVFTEHGAIMAATILNSPKAVEMSVFIVRAFVQLREMLSTNKELAAKLLELERKVSGHDQAIAGLIEAIRQLMAHPSGNSRPIGFTADIGTKK